MSSVHHENSIAIVFDDDFQFNSFLASNSVLNAQYEESTNQFQNSLVSNDSTPFQQPFMKEPDFSAYQLSLNQNPSFTGFSSGNHFDAPYPNNDPDFFTSGPITGSVGHFPSNTVAPFNPQDQGHPIPETLQPNSLFLAPMPPLPTPALQAVAVGPNPSILPDTFQHGPLPSRQRGITAADGLHLCHNHHNLVQSIAEYKHSVSFIHFDSSSCIFCITLPLQSASMAPQTTAISASINSRNDMPSHAPEVYYCSFPTCNRAIGSDRAFNRNDNRNEHEHRVHGIPRRRRN